MVILSLAQAKSTQNKLNALGIFIHDADDIKQDAALLGLERPELDASEIIAILVQRAKQSRANSIICSVSLHPQDDGLDPLDYLPICSCFDSGDDGAGLPRWRTATDQEIQDAGGPTNLENFRFEVKGRHGQPLTNRRVRQKFQQLAEQFSGRQSSIFDLNRKAA